MPQLWYGSTQIGFDPSEICKFVVGIDETVPFGFAEREPP